MQTMPTQEMRPHHPECGSDSDQTDKNYCANRLALRRELTMGEPLEGSLESASGTSHHEGETKREMLHSALS
jgi:hypothetical protein